MANIRTHPYEWERMLYLLDLDELNEDNESELGELQKLFGTGDSKRKRQPRREQLLPVNQKIKQLVLESGLSLNKITQFSGIGHGTLGNIIRGETKNINLKTAFLLADFFKIDVNEFREENL
ncbi:helix-turn-helix domain-containing protein [Aerococcaceae bacterium WGS1372]